jgi:hypothetical protein
MEKESKVREAHKERIGEEDLRGDTKAIAVRREEGWLRTTEDLR